MIKPLSIEQQLYNAVQLANKHRKTLEDNQLKLSELWERLNADPEFGNDHWISQIIVNIVTDTRWKIGPDDVDVGNRTVDAEIIIDTPALSKE